MMDSLANFHFLRPGWLLLIPLLIGLWWLWRRRTEPLRGWKEQIRPELLRVLITGNSAASDRSAIAWLVVWVISVTAIAGPTWKLEPNPFMDDSAPLMILLKSSESMDLADPAPARLERAKMKIADLARLRKGQPMGLIAYAGSAHLVLPPTKDTDVVSQMASEISPSIMPKPGDRLDLAIIKAMELLRQESSGGSLLVVADSIEQSPQTISDARAGVGGDAIQFLAIIEENSPEAKTIRQVAKRLGSADHQLTVNDEDIKAITEIAERISSGGIEGETNRWQEAGYWLTPLIGIILAYSFRRQRRGVP